jgi:hypothetical protein
MDSINLQNVFEFVLAALMAIIGWFLREMWTAVQKLKDDLSSMREDLPRNYIQKDDYKADIGRIHELLDKIYDRMAK